MGLDSIELVMEVENAFGIRITDIEAEKIITVGNFHDVVWRHLEGRQLDKCHSQSLFYKLRGSISDTYGYPKSKITLDTSPGSLFPEKNRRGEYQQFKSKVGLDLPALELPNPWSDILASIAITLILGSLLLEIILIIFFDFNFWILLWTLASTFIVLGLSELLNPLRTQLREPTLKEFTSQVLALNYKNLVKNSGSNRREMETVINHIIANKVGLDLEEVTSEKRIADDLGVD